MAVNLRSHSLGLLTGREDVVNPRSRSGWAVFTYDGDTNDLKLLECGAGGLQEMTHKFRNNSVMYGFCSIKDPKTAATNFILVNWVGEQVTMSRRQDCVKHLPDIRAFFREANVVVSAQTPADLSLQNMELIIATAATRRRPSRARREADEPVGTTYMRTNPAMEMRQLNRDLFWKQAEKEEEVRKEEEKKRVREERLRWEREWMQQERREAAGREQQYREREQLTEQQRKAQAKLEAENRKKERMNWERQEREHEAEMRDRLLRSASIEEAAEAASLVSLRSVNPRELFKQKEQAGLSVSGHPPCLGSTRTVSGEEVTGPIGRDLALIGVTEEHDQTEDTTVEETVPTDDPAPPAEIESRDGQGLAEAETMQSLCSQTVSKEAGMDTEEDELVTVGPPSLVWTSVTERDRPSTSENGESS